MWFEELVANSMVMLGVGGWAALRLSRCTGCEAPFSLLEALFKAFTWSWTCGRCRREAPEVAEVVELHPVNAEMVRRHEEILAGWRSLASG